MLENAFWLAAVFWREGKNAIEDTLPVDNAGLHALLGIFLFVAIASLITWRRRWLISWVVVLAIASWNEVVDIATERWPDINEQFVEAGFDLWATMAFPTAALLILFAWQRLVPPRFEEG